MVNCFNLLLHNYININMPVSWTRTWTRHMLDSLQVWLELRMWGIFSETQCACLHWWQAHIPWRISRAKWHMLSKYFHFRAQCWLFQVLRSSFHVYIGRQCRNWFTPFLRQLFSRPWRGASSEKCLLAWHHFLVRYSDNRDIFLNRLI